MTDTTHESPDLLPCPFCGGVAKYYHRPDTTGWSNTEWVSCSGDCSASTCMHKTKEGAIAAWNTRSDALVQAAVAAALREAINRVNGCDRISEVQPAILALITPDAQAALAAERERAYNAGRKHERDLIYAFAQRMDTEGKAYAEQILAAIREGAK